MPTAYIGFTAEAQRLLHDEPGQRRAAVAEENGELLPLIACNPTQFLRHSRRGRCVAAPLGRRGPAAEPERTGCVLGSVLARDVFDHTMTISGMIGQSGLRVFREYIATPCVMASPLAGCTSLDSIGWGRRIFSRRCKALDLIVFSANNREGPPPCYKCRWVLGCQPTTSTRRDLTKLGRCWIPVLALSLLGGPDGRTRRPVAPRRRRRRLRRIHRPRLSPAPRVSRPCPVSFSGQADLLRGFRRTRCSCRCLAKDGGLQDAQPDAAGRGMLEEVAAQLLDRGLDSLPNRKLSGAEVVTLVKHMARKGWVLALNANQKGANPFVGTCVLRGLRPPKTRRPSRLPAG